MNTELITKIKDAYADYCYAEFAEETSITYLEKLTTLDLMYTEIGGHEQYQVQLSYDLVAEKIILTFCGINKNVYYDKECPLQEFYDLISTTSYQDFYSLAHDIVEEQLGIENIEW